MGLNDNRNIVKAIRNMSDNELELYIYSLKKMAEVNVESNKMFLTGLNNLKSFFYKAAEVLMANLDKKYAVIVMDYANFKVVNEFCGRDGGDGLLLHTAKVLEEESSEESVLCHARADIFAVMMPYENQSELVDFIRRLDIRISEYKIYYKVLPAFGICLSDGDTRSVNNMYDYARMALATIKGKFYARYAFFDADMKEKLLLNKMIESDIVSALEKREIELFIQPKVSMLSGEIIGGEALVRWNHPEKGYVSPGSFIPVLEKDGLIIEMDMYIWEEVFKLIGERIKQGKKVVPISINISRLHIFDKRFKESLVSLSEKYNVPSEYVVLELTESGFLEDSTNIYEDMSYLRSKGFKVSMDDFGTGYSSMTMLKNQPVDEIKIDRGFIIDIEDTRSQSIIKHTVEMLKELGKSIIVEGVENETQRDFLVECGCVATQGFMYYKPMKAELYEELLDK